MQSKGAIRNGVETLTSSDGVEIYEHSSKVVVNRKYLASVHRSIGGQKIAGVYPFATTGITQLEVTVEGTQCVLEEVNPGK